MQVEKLSNELLDSCDQFRESMGEVADNVSLAVALETLWSERIENSSSGKPNCMVPPRLIARCSKPLTGILTISETTRKCRQGRTLAAHFTPECKPQSAQIQV